MKASRRDIGIAALLLALMAPFPLAQRSSSAATPGIAIALGDSIAAGIGSSLPRTRGNAAIAADWLARLTGETVPSQNLAVPGETTTSFVENGQLQRFRDTASDAREAGIPIAYVSLSLGGNELLSLHTSGLTDRQAALDDFRTRYADVLGTLRDEIGADIPLIVMTLYDLTDGDATIQYSDSWWIEQFNDAIRNAASDHGALVADVGERFTGHISEYTHYPFDVHPTNAGHLAIAQEIWSTLGIDDEPPTIDVETDVVATRRTPTIQFTVDDNVAVSSVTASSDDVVIRGPFEKMSKTYVLLVELPPDAPEKVALTIDISDDAGNLRRQEITVTQAVTSRSESH